MLRQMQNLCIVPEISEVFFRLSVFKLAYLGLRKSQPSTQQLLIERLPEQLKVARVVPIRLEDLPNVMTREGCAKRISLEEFISKLRRGCPQLVALLSQALAAHSGRIIGSEQGPAFRAVP
ncbi:hypothetical protein BB31_29945 [Amycolatopsis lurida NRRL 2430]|uniref:Uncharacterized protein n=2 Tax=Amycolatopsis lurida TaxID=31959 RepID=A0A2P2FLS4_AMYLU|nr:hypothetical protein BB31_29945 [Amycolatopsis lurida NRRL 2430]